EQLALPSPVPVTGCSARHPCVAWTLITRATQSVVQLRFHEFLDEPPDPIPDSHLNRIKPPRAQKIRRRTWQLSAILLHGVFSIGVSTPSLAWRTKPEITPL